MALKLAALVRKNLTLLLRSRSSALILIFGPLLLIILVSIAFNTANPYSIIVGVYSEQYGTLTDALLQGLQEKEMSIVHSDSKDACIKGVKNGVFTVCALFPSDFTAREGGTVKFFVDPSRENLVYLVVEQLTKEVAEKSKSISTQLTADVVVALSETGQQLTDKQILLGQMSENNRDIEDIAERLQRNLQSLNLSVSMDVFPFAALENALGSDSSGNETSAALKWMKEIRERVGQLVGNANYAHGITGIALNDLGTVGVLVDENTNYVTVLDSSFDDALRGIRAVKQQSVGKIVSPLEADIESVVPEKTHLNYLFPTLVALLVMFIGLFLSSSLEIREKVTKVHFKNMIAPTSHFLFILGNFITNMLVIMMQLLVIFVAALFFFKEALFPVFGDVVVVLLLMAAVFVFLGMLIGVVFKSEETGVVAALSTGFLLLFFSSTILPVEALPTFIKGLTVYNPFYASQFLLGKILLFQQGLGDLLPPVLILVWWLAGLFALVVAGKALIKNDE